MATESTCFNHPGHWNRKTQEALIIESLWEPRPTPGRRLTPKIKERIASLYRHGYNIVEIAEWFYQDKTKTRQIIISGGIQIRRGRMRYNITETQWEAKKAEYDYRFEGLLCPQGFLEARYTLFVFGER